MSLNYQEGARLAKKEGKILKSGLQPVKIFWKQQGRKRTTSGTFTCTTCVISFTTL